MAFSVDLSSASLPPDVATGLFASWLDKFAKERHGTTQAQYPSPGTGFTGKGQMIFGNPLGLSFVLEQEGSVFTLTKCTELSESDAESMMSDAAARTVASDWGGVVVYQVEMTVAGLDASTVMGPHFMRSLGDQRHVTGARRLHDTVLLDFPETEAVGPFAPESVVMASIFVPGPTAGMFASYIADAVCEFSAAVVALATGRPVTYPPVLFPVTDNDDIAEVMRRRTDPGILTLARNGVSLDVWGDIPQRGGQDVLDRMRGSLLAYQAAIEQRNPDVAVMLLVTAIEALVAPRQSWGRDGVTNRFIRFLTELCPDAVDEFVNHSNVEQAFGYVKKGGSARQRKDALSTLYAARSLPSHAGLDLARGGLNMGSPGSLRVAIASSLACDAILAFIEAPRSSIYGMPGTVETEPRESSA